MKQRSVLAFVLSISAILVGCESMRAASEFIRTQLFAGDVEDGEAVGTWTYWYENGSKLAQGDYRDDKQIGRWTYWYPNGAVEWVGGFNSTRLDGPSLFYHPNGDRRAQGDFRDGFEEGGWRFWSEEGVLRVDGDYVRGQAALRWVHFDSEGELQAEGYRLRDEKVGVWQYWDETGELHEIAYPLPAGLRIVYESWDDGSPRREGFLLQAHASGRWVTYHRSGERRAEGDFDKGVPNGAWRFWNERGEPVASGFVKEGQFAGDWRIWPNGLEESIPGSKLTPPEPLDGVWSPDGVADELPVEEFVGVWLAEAAAPVTGVVASTVSPDLSPPSEALVLKSDRLPIVPLRPQPWTVRERDSLEFLVARYTDGAESVQPPPGDRRYGRRRRRSADPTGDLSKSKPMLGKPLPQTVFTDSAGTEIDLADLRGKKVCAVILRGFTREVCVYCVTQTEALADSVGEFAARNTEVVVIYPGEKNRLDAFVASCETVTQREGGLPLTVLYDPDASLARELDIVHELAIPTTVLLDENGTVRYAYVGEEIDDRPSVKDLLSKIDALSAP